MNDIKKSSIFISQESHVKTFVLLLCPVFLYSYNLEELVEISQKNRLVESATLSVTAREKAYQSTKSTYLPTLNLGASYLNTLNETPASAENTLRATVSLQYTLYDGGKKDALYEKLLYNVDASKESLESVKNTISLDVTRLYFDYLSFMSYKEATNQQIKQLEAELQRLQMYYKIGSVTRDEVDKIDSRVKLEKVVLNEIDLDIARILHTLEYYTMKNITQVDAGSSIDMGETQKVQMRPDIKILELETKSLMYDAQTAKSENLPTLYLDNTYTYSDYYFADNANKSPFVVSNQNVASLNLKWNVFDFGARTEAYEAKQSEYLSQKASLEHQINKADVDYRLSQKELEIIKLKIAATKATLDAASATYKLIKLKYQNGAIDNVAYLQSLSEKFNAQRVYEKAKNDLEIKKAEVLFYSGHIIKEYFR
ncbi:TolC family protein [Sulfurimonas aquatica]|uniref:TolC family protein n=1 Tax=Sulfurimonas aquatica TaxID=2672570 RepID=A0A975AYX5_9BACT|nr:TolC family protein [Sulfurimonas aquatica]QSZ41083.1 TolC family protein [Sulfurimonas aquatica]